VYKISDPKSIKRKSINEEKSLAKKFKLHTQPASGAIAGFKGDLKSREFLFDAKSTKHQSFSVNINDLGKIRKEAFGAGKEPVLLINFTEINQIESEYAVIPMSLF